MEESWLDKLANFPSRNMDNPPSLSAQLGAMGREALKDVRETMFETFFGKGDGPGEMGAPLNPTPQIVTDDLEKGQSFQEMLREASQRGGQGQSQEMER